METNSDSLAKVHLVLRKANEGIFQRMVSLLRQERVSSVQPMFTHGIVKTQPFRPIKQG